MLLITCPHCGPRNEDEFVCWSAVDTRPSDPTATSDAEWVHYVYDFANAKGRARERWWHAAGCGRWLLVDRDTVTHEIHGVESATP